MPKRKKPYPDSAVPSRVNAIAPDGRAAESRRATAPAGIGASQPVLGNDVVGARHVARSASLSRPGRTYTLWFHTNASQALSGDLTAHGGPSLRRSTMRAV